MRNKRFLLVAGSLLVTSYHAQATLYECKNTDNLFIRTEVLSDCKEGKGTPVDEKEINPFLSSDVSTDKKISSPNVSVTELDVLLADLKQEMIQVREASKEKVVLLRGKRQAQVDSIKHYDVLAKEYQDSIQIEKKSMQEDVKVLKIKLERKEKVLKKLIKKISKVKD